MRSSRPPTELGPARRVQALRRPPLLDLLQERHDRLQEGVLEGAALIGSMCAYVFVRSTVFTQLFGTSDCFASWRVASATRPPPSEVSNEYIGSLTKSPLIAWSP